MFASAAAMLCVVSLWMLQHSIDEIEYHDLQERAEDVQLVLSHEPPGQSMQSLTSALASVYEFKDDGKYLQIRDEQGNWLFRSKRMMAQNPDLPPPKMLPRIGQINEFRQGIHYVRVLAYPIAVREKLYSVQTGVARNRSMVLFASFRTKLLLLAPIVILLAAAGGHAMSRKALAPVAALTAEARRINDRNLDIRLPVSNAKDEISNLSRTLNQMLERIDKAFASVRSFTGNASHELRTPIALLRTEIEVALYRDRNVDEYRQVLGRLHQEAVQMTSLVENLLSLARTDGGADTLSFAPICLDSLLHDADQTWTNAANHALLKFSVEMPSAGLYVLGDACGIQRLLSILLENAIKYTPSGGTVTLLPNIEGERVSIEVKDTGIGIPHEYRSRIFERFFRGTAKNGISNNGSGLGLALAKWIAERHGTELSVESELGLGSRFSFSLKRANPPNCTTQRQARSAAALPSQSPHVQASN
jgi:signal transduction histidine kinase